VVVKVSAGVERGTDQCVNSVVSVFSGLEICPGRYRSR